MLVVDKRGADFRVADIKMALEGSGVIFLDDIVDSDIAGEGNCRTESRCIMCYGKNISGFCACIDTTTPFKSRTKRRW
jgi:hypothetical protein